jgi:hypothetical protein
MDELDREILKTKEQRAELAKATPAPAKFSPEFIQALHGLFTLSINEGYDCPLLIDIYKWAMEQNQAGIGGALERLDNKIEDLELAAKLRPPPAFAGNGAAEPETQTPPQSRAGRRPGVASEPYAGLLAALAVNGARAYNTGEIANLARRFGIQKTPKRMGDAMWRLAAKGLAERRGRGLYRVSPEMAERARGDAGA